jgi:HD-GYP domain-containing protein (c-di-GMP phosphodiesterase class II)
VSITIEQGELALLASGKLDAVQRALDSLPGEQGIAVRIKWSNKARAIRRDSATVAAVLGKMLGMTDAEIDALFISAVGL